MLVSICLIFNQYKPGVAYKGVAYKKKRVPPENILTLTLLKRTNPKHFFARICEKLWKIFLKTFVSLGTVFL